MFLRSPDPDSSTSRYEVLADIKLELELCHNNPAAAGRGDTESCAGHRTARRHTTGAVTTRAQGAGGHGGADIFWCSDIFWASPGTCWWQPGAGWWWWVTLALVTRCHWADRRLPTAEQSGARGQRADRHSSCPQAPAFYSEEQRALAQGARPVCCTKY